jgi:DNA adenine methylase
VRGQDGLLAKASRALAGVTLLQGDFEPILDLAGKGDVAYCDPTYTVTHELNGFVRYNEKNFAWSDQERLASAARRAADRGAVVLVSNAHHQEVRTLYATANVLELMRKSLVSRDRTKRRAVSEYLFVLGPGTGSA